MALTSSLPHRGPLVPTPFRPGIRYQIRAFWMSLCRAYFHRLFDDAFCFSTVHQYRFHLLKQFLKIRLEYLCERSLLHRSKHEESSACEYPFPQQWQQRVNPLKTSAKCWTILFGLNAKAICRVSIRNDNGCIAPFLVGQSKVLYNHNVNTLTAFSYG